METRVGTLDGDESGYAGWRREWVRCMEKRLGMRQGEKMGVDLISFPSARNASVRAQAALVLNL